MADFIQARVRSIELNRAEIQRVVGRQSIKAITKMAVAVEAQAKMNASGPPRGEIRAQKKIGRQELTAEEKAYAARQPLDVAVGGLGMRTGAGRGSITHSIAEEGLKVRAFVGSDLIYMFWNEYGTRRMPARPWLRPALVSVMRRHTDWFK